MKKVWAANTKVVVFDWDDTIFPTKSYSSNKNYNKEIKCLDVIYGSLINFLVNNMYDVYIISNANLVWIYFCINMMKNIKKIQKKIRILSARDLYENVCEISLWKTMSFIKHIPRCDSIISIGDQKFEIDALISYVKFHNIKNY